MKPSEIHEQLDAIYASIPNLDCQRKCQECCGPILCSGVEFRRMKDASLVPLGKMKGMDCPALIGGSCAVYSVRPIICRLWGVVKEMACPHGCLPERWLSDSEAKDLLRRIRKLTGGEIDGPAVDRIPLLTPPQGSA